MFWYCGCLAMDRSVEINIVAVYSTFVYSTRNHTLI